MDPTENQRKIQQMKILVIISIIVLTILSLRGAVYMKEINNDNYITAIAQALTDITSGNFAILPFNNLTLKYELYSILIIAIVTGLWYGTFAFNKDMMRGKEFGSTDFNSNFDKYNKEFSDPKGSPKYNGDYNMILGENIRLNLDTRKTRRNNNVLCTGGSGTGKSRFLCGPNILQANTSYVVTDPSGELLRDYGSFLEGQGYKIKVFNLVDMVHSNCYNPFHYIRDDLGVMIMINCLIRNTDNGGKGGDPFWEKSETALLQALIFYLIKYRPKEEQNFNSVLSLIELAHIDENNPNAKSKLDIIFENVEKEDPQGIAIKQYKIFKQGAGKTLKSILISAAVRLSVFNIKEISKLTKVDNLDLGKVGDEKTALFVIIPSADSTYNFLVSMMYSQLFETLYYHAENECGFSKRLPHHVRFLLDEFANIGQIPEFEKKLATMRKYEISCTIILQSLSQLKTLYDKSWNGIIGNCDTYLHLGSQEEETNKYVSDLLGTKTIRSENISRTNRSGKKGSTSNGRQARKLMLPEEIAQMDNLQCLILIRGLRPFKVNKYPLENHPNYKFTGGANKNNNFEIKKHPELLIKDNITLQDIKREIKKSQVNKIIGRPQNAVSGILEAFNTTLDSDANNYLKANIKPAPINTSAEDDTAVKNNKNEQIYQNQHNSEFDDAPVHTITENNMRDSEREVRNKKKNNYNNKNNHKHNINKNYNKKNNNHYNKNTSNNITEDDIENMIESQIGNIADEIMDEDFN